MPRANARRCVHVCMHARACVRICGCALAGVFVDARLHVYLWMHVCVRICGLESYLAKRTNSFASFLLARPTFALSKLFVGIFSRIFRGVSIWDSNFCITPNQNISQIVGSNIGDSAQKSTYFAKVTKRIQLLPNVGSFRRFSKLMKREHFTGFQ